MIVSLNWIKQYVDIDMPVEKLTELIGARLVEIEEVIDISARYQCIVTVKVVSCTPHPNADKLKVCMIDDGGKTSGVERDKNKLIQVVCGAPNVREGMIVAWVPPGVTVPMTASDDEPFTVGAKEIRGVKSNGMLASAKELAIGDNHEGLLELNDAKLGVDFAHFYELNDYLLDIENKSLTHRPDCFGVIGLAREIAALTGKQFKTPNWLGDIAPKFEKSDDISLKVTIKNPELCPRYQAIVLKNADQNVSSPVKVQSYLARVGVKPINAIVDVTNYLMLLTGQPLHAFDYDKFAALSKNQPEVIVRAGQKGEKLALLDGKTIELTNQDIVIASGKVPVALAGAMGGSSTAIDADTKNILVESASFNLYNLRGTQMRHGIFTESITRFTKGQSPKQTAPVLAEAVGMLQEITSAKPASILAESYPKKPQATNLVFQAQEINNILGTSYTTSEVASTLKHVEFDVHTNANTIKVEVPYWRADINITEDIADEIGRINGFDEIKPVLPYRQFVAVQPSELEKLKQKIRSSLARAGANDVLTYSFVHGDLLKAVGQKPEDSYAIVNAISPRLQYYRQTLTPSLLELVHPNIKAGFSEFSLFEINKTHNKVHGKDSDGLPGELEMTALVYANKKSSKDSPFYVVRRQLDFLAAQLGLTFAYQPIDKKPNFPVTEPFDWKRSAYITEKTSGMFIGIMGEYRQQVVKNLKLPNQVAGCELGTEDILKAIQSTPKLYTPLSRYPGTAQDITLQVSAETSFNKVQNSIEEALQNTELEWQVAPLGIYQPDGRKTKNISFRIYLTNHEKTMTREMVQSVIEDAARSANQKVDAKQI